MDNFNNVQFNEAWNIGLHDLCHYINVQQVYLMQWAEDNEDERGSMSVWAIETMQDAQQGIWELEAEYRILILKWLKIVDDPSIVKDDALADELNAEIFAVFDMAVDLHQMYFSTTKI